MLNQLVNALSVQGNANYHLKRAISY